MEPQTAVVLGATGLIGSELVKLLLEDADILKVRLLVRRPFALQHQKLETVIVDFNDLNDYAKKLGNGDSIFCCIGTTQSKVKRDKDLYRTIDHDIAVNAAQIGLKAGFKKFLLVSAVGASKQSRNFYLKLKGEVEEDVVAANIPATYIFRPSMLYGNRKEFRLGETVAKAMMKVLSSIMLGSFKKYRGIEASDVAKAMVAASKTQRTGKSIYEYSDMKSLL